MVVVINPSQEGGTGEEPGGWKVEEGTGCVNNPGKVTAFGGFHARCSLFPYPFTIV